MNKQKYVINKSNKQNKSKVCNTDIKSSRHNIFIYLIMYVCLFSVIEFTLIQKNVKFYHSLRN